MNAKVIRMCQEYHDSNSPSVLANLTLYRGTFCHQVPEWGVEFQLFEQAPPPTQPPCAHMHVLTEHKVETIATRLVYLHG